MPYLKKKVFEENYVIQVDTKDGVPVKVILTDQDNVFAKVWKEWYIAMEIENDWDLSLTVPKSLWFKYK